MQHIREGISLSAEGWRNPPDGNGHARTPSPVHQRTVNGL